MYVVAESEIAGLMTPEAAFEAIEAVFASMARRKAWNFPVVREAIGHEDALYGFKGGFDAAGLVLGLKAGGYWPNNQKHGLINHQSTVFLFDPDTGRVRAAIGGNLLTALRTAAAAAVSIRYLAPRGARVLGMIGAGHQSAFQMRAAAAVHDFDRVLGWNPHPEMLGRLAETAADLGLPFEAVDLPRLGAEADVIISITSSFSALLMDGHVQGPTHIAAMGTDTRGKQELDPALLARARVFTDELAQAISIGECQHAIDQGLIAQDQIRELGAVVAGIDPGRENAELTIFDGTGVGLQDLAVASRTLEIAIQKGVAQKVNI
ncbi:MULTISPECIES: iminosuccinate reductase BhcD [unclassified Paracoccus (in: a-proteobacteria)]|uniref:iminosuccinate reductase BhcD n=1 Tax=unclassified Paracoccus (in: a-proteobacteria) TaxID=2688777 RepID=UPI0012B22E26|nr:MULTISPECIES: iminosuccinate reductase BhcD [unclassified Paracoccus (in: a-proteobacteria)]UXU75896.1 ornithine cyclodeaminase family protein [Paracoccus sp. SMMA_5]UXU76472.1 ornithine cyclodeaminase family protein [Paracoccus sp. SMMA_5]UXU81806.1 ornithine cyclodeaminase family protein [Paracoccus sp. SMMA_5_TC]UXU82190.1 ornithine cyclodeaminase family protein [Paracoccus sp. SMMA_5_TC]